ncbi:MAG: diguanylate cyclase domain-containing protein [Desulfurella sp.]|uniref:diguanylate cyclase domain-containing protein n=2 Tax=Desulfurella sp. TaxID=1962857 RepID=UPI003D0E7DB3
MSKKIFKSQLSRYFILSWAAISIIIFILVFVVFVKLYEKVLVNTESELSTIARQSAFAVQTYVELLHMAENSFKDSIEENFYTDKIPIMTKNIVDQNPDIYAVLIVAHDKQIIYSYPQKFEDKLAKQITICSKSGINVSSAFREDNMLMVADCIPFSKGYILVGRVPVLMLVKPLINIQYKSFNVFILKKDGKLQNSLKKIDLPDYKDYIQLSKHTSGYFKTASHLVSYAKIQNTGRILFVSISKKEIYENFFKSLLPFFLIILASFVIFSFILFWVFYKLQYFEKLKKMSISFVKISNDVNALMIDKISFRSLIDKISQKFVENPYIDLCIFYFKEKNEMKIKSYSAKKDCLECFELKALSDKLCSVYFLDLAKNSLKARIINAKNSQIYKHCGIKFVGVFPVVFENKIIGSLIIAGKNGIVLHSSEISDILMQFLDNFKNKLKLMKLEKLQESGKSKARYFAYHDQLTGLNNRSFFIERFNQAIAKSRRIKTNVALFSMDLDGFKAINDTFGHDIGDRLLKAVAKRLKSVVRQEDTLSRFGGDEFLLFTDSFETKEELEEIAKRILNTIKKPFIIDTYQMSVGISIGIAYSLGITNASQEDYLKVADELLYTSKKTGKNKYTIAEV